MLKWGTGGGTEKLAAIAVQRYTNFSFVFFQFPVCDGSHNKHNELTGDNVGPLILKKKEV